MKGNTIEKQLAELTVRHDNITKAMASLEGSLLFDMDWVKKNILQIKDDEG